MIIIIDPGLNGGLSTYSKNVLKLYKMPTNIVDYFDFLYSLVYESNHIYVYIENVGKHRKGNNASASVTFARHVGNLEQLLIIFKRLGYIDSIEYINSNEWMEYYPLRPIGSSNRVSRKKYIKLLMISWFSIKVTLYTSDALAMLIYILDKKF